MLRFIIFIGLLVTSDIDGTIHPHVSIPASSVASHFPGLIATTEEKALTAAQLPSASIPTPEEVPDEVPTIDDSEVSAAGAPGGALPAPGGPLPPIYPPQNYLGYNCHQGTFCYFT